MLVVHAQNEDITMGLIVDRVGGIFDLPEEQIRSPSAPIDDKISAYMRGVSDYRERLFVVLDLNRLLLSPEIQQFQ
jgi:chemotaxis signal transduction protein